MDVKILFVKITYLLDPEIRKCWKGVCLVMGISCSILVYDLYFCHRHLNSISKTGILQ